jgi:MFS family permease
LFALELSNSLAFPALIAAAYSFLSILLTLFGFRESLPPDKRRITSAGWSSVAFTMLRTLRSPQLQPLMVLMFAQQVVFFGFESLLGLFTLSRLGLLGQGNALIFIYVGMILVYVQARLIGKWSQKYGERKLVFIALAALAIGLLLLAFTPDQPHPLYVQRRVEFELRSLAPTSTEAIIGDIPITLPEDSQRGFGGILWFLLGIIPLAIGAGLIRPALNSLMIQRANPGESGAVLGVSASLVSLANAVAPLIGGWIFQLHGEAAPFLIGGVVMAALLLVSLVAIRSQSVLYQSEA